jgi:hypothetical protein
MTLSVTPETGQLTGRLSSLTCFRYVKELDGKMEQTQLALGHSYSRAKASALEEMHANLSCSHPMHPLTRRPRGPMTILLDA